MTVNGASLSKIKKKLLPATDGQDVARLRNGIIAVVNPDGTADITLNGATIPDVPAIGSAALWAGASVQMISYRGSLLILGPGGSGKQILKKAADQLLTLNSTTLQNVSDLVFPAAANGVYQATLWLSYDGNNTQDMKVAWSVPAGATMLRHILSPSTTTGDVNNNSVAMPRRDATTEQQAGAPTTTNGFAVHREDIVLTMGSTAGNVQVQAAQLAAGSSSPQGVVRASSLILLERFA